MRFQRWLKLVTAIVVVCTPCIDWTRMKGTVTGINMHAYTMTLRDHDGNIFTVPIDYQVQIIDSKNVAHVLKDVRLDDKVTLIHILTDKPPEDTEGLVPPKF